MRLARCFYLKQSRLPGFADQKWLQEKAAKIKLRLLWRWKNALGLKTEKLDCAA